MSERADLLESWDTRVGDGGGDEEKASGMRGREQQHALSGQRLQQSAKRGGTTGSQSAADSLSHSLGVVVFLSLSHTLTSPQSVEMSS